MAVYVGLLRGINVGGSGKLPMSDLVSMCLDVGFTSVQTYIQSGNVIFQTDFDAQSAKARLEAALAVRLGKPYAAMLRSPAEMDDVLTRNPFGQEDPRKVNVLFLDDAAPPDAAAAASATGPEVVVPSGREVFVYYPEGMGRSRLNLPQARTGTGRNLNTVARLAEMARRAERG